VGGPARAALVLLSLEPEVAAAVIRCLTDDEAELLGSHLAQPVTADPDTRLEVLASFLGLLEARTTVAGGFDYATELLERTLGPARAREILARLRSEPLSRPFEIARRTPPQQLVGFLEGEQPQTVALVLSFLTAEQASAVLTALPADIQADVTRRMALMDATAPDVISEVETVLRARLGSMSQDQYSTPGGVDVLVNILNRVDRTTERAIMSALEDRDRDLAEEVRRRMFLFEDLVSLDDRALQRLLRDVDGHDLALALKGTPDSVAQRFLSNMSQRAADAVREEITYLGPVRVRDVEESQRRILATARRLEEANEIVLARAGAEDLVL
jgi:flagellar motor switch protein FliG